MTSSVANILTRIARNRLLQHLLFWALSFFVLINVLRVSANLQFIDVVYAAIFHLCLVMPVYANLYYLVPKLLANQKYFAYGLALLLLVLLGIGFYFLLFNHLIDFILPGYFFIAYYSFFDVTLFLSVYIFLTTLLKLARAWFALSELHNENTQNKLKALKAQVNPHFLFNTLSSIYSLSRKKSDKTPEVIMKLSDTLRYMLYEADGEMIALFKEIEIIRNIVEIHRLRMGEQIEINFDFPELSDEVEIAPLLLIPFVENCFKHVKPDSHKKQFVKISIEVKNGILLFNSSNSKNEQQNKYVDGIGLENVRKRLDLIYPKVHKLNVENENETFRVALELKL